MKKGLNILIYCLALFSCAKFHYHDITDGHKTYVNVVMTVQEDVDSFSADFKTGLLYDWDELRYGKIDDYNVDTVLCKIFNESLEIVDEIEIALGKEKALKIEYPNLYNMLIYNKTYSTKYSFNGLKYNCEVGYLGKEPSFNFTEQYGVINQCEKQYTVYERDLFSVFDENKIEPYEKSIEKDGTVTFYCYDSVLLAQISFVYLVQIIIHDDDKEIPMLVTSCDYIGISGVAEMAEMFEKKNGIYKGVIELNDIKPLQFREDYAVCCSKLITYGLPSKKESSWGESQKCEIGLQFSLSNGTVKRGKVSAARKFIEKPKGGIITVAVNNSDIYKSSDYQNNGMDVDVEQWDEYVFDILF